MVLTAVVVNTVENIFCIMHKNTQRNTSENKVIKSMKKLFNTSTFQ